jgi:YD repeat-containing protein
VLWRNLPAGNYTITLGGAVSGKIDPDGNPPDSQPVSVVAQSTNTVALEYDTPGRIQNVTFRTEPYGNGTLISSTADSLMVDHPSMNSPKIYTPSGGGFASSFTTPSELYPFPSVYTAYAGTCTDNNAGSGASIAGISVPAGGSGGVPSPGYITLPALHLTVRTGSSSSNPGSVATGARVEVEDDDCGITRVLWTNGSGQLSRSASGVADPGLPYGLDYEVCASDSVSGNTRRNWARTSGGSIDDFGLTSTSSGTVKTIYLTGSGSGSGTC